MSGLTDFQAEVTRLFFSLAASDGFLLAGGGGLLAAGLTARPTQDLDFFGAPGGADIGAASDQFEAAVMSTIVGLRSPSLIERASGFGMLLSRQLRIVPLALLALSACTGQTEPSTTPTAPTAPRDSTTVTSIARGEIEARFVEGEQYEASGVVEAEPFRDEFNRFVIEIAFDDLVYDAPIGLVFVAQANFDCDEAAVQPGDAVRITYTYTEDIEAAEPPPFRADSVRC